MGHSSDTRNSMPRWKLAAFSVVVCAGFFGLAEVGLAIFGVTPVAHDMDPQVGFARQPRLFVESRAEGGEVAMATAPNKLRFFNTQRFAKRKADGTYRIFCLGGSTTYGRPYNDKTSFCGWLRVLLPAADRSRQWEVINADGISYASDRVLNVARELTAYEPDLLLVYTGQNEFLERRTTKRSSTNRGLSARSTRC